VHERVLKPRLCPHESECFLQWTCGWSKGGLPLLRSHWSVE